MGKRGKKLTERQKPRCLPLAGDEDDDVLPSSAYDLPSPPTGDQEGGEEGKTEEVEDEEEQNGGGEGRAEEWAFSGPPSKFHLYQRSVQVPLLYLLFPFFLSSYRLPAFVSFHSLFSLLLNILLVNLDGGIGCSRRRGT